MSSQGSDPVRRGPATDSAAAGEPQAQRDVWSFTAERASGVELAGYRVEATDGRIGKVDEATDAVGASQLIVDTGPWIFGKRVLLPAGVVERIDAASETVFVGRTRDEIKDAPPFDEDSLLHDEGYRDRLASYYGQRSARTSS